MNWKCWSILIRRTYISRNVKCLYLDGGKERFDPVFYEISSFKFQTNKNRQKVIELAHGILWFYHSSLLNLNTFEFEKAGNDFKILCIQKSGALFDERCHIEYGWFHHNCCRIEQPLWWNQQHMKCESIHGIRCQVFGY